MKRLVFILPIAAFAVIAFFLFRSLVSPAPNVLPSALLNKKVPDRVLPPLDAQAQGFGPQELSSGKVTLVNVFSSTCIPCRLEAPMMMRLSAMPGMTIYGLVWEDKPQDARRFLDQLGNPFSRIGLDEDGSIGRDWGIYGWPETYVVDGHGVIRFKYVGELTERVVQQLLLPAIEKAKLAS